MFCAFFLQKTALRRSYLHPSFIRSVCLHRMPLHSMYTTSDYGYVSMTALWNCHVGFTSETRMRCCRIIGVALSHQLRVYCEISFIFWRKKKTQCSYLQSMHTPCIKSSWIPKRKFSNVPNVIFQLYPKGATKSICLHTILNESKY